MPININFYLLPYATIEACGLYICRLIEKVYKKNHRIYILTSTEHETRTLNDLLWTFKDISFIPHNIYEENPTSPAPIQIGSSKEQPNNHNDILINLTLEVPNFYANFKHVLEIVPNNTTARESSRKKYKFYQQQGCKLETHNIA
jgi:DNA polymerase-3 subunit chi